MDLDLFNFFRLLFLASQFRRLCGAAPDFWGAAGV